MAQDGESKSIYEGGNFQLTFNVLKYQERDCSFILDKGNYVNVKGHLIKILLN